MRKLLRISSVLAILFATSLAFAARSKYDKRIFYGEPNISASPAISAKTDTGSGTVDGEADGGVFGGLRLGWRIQYLHFVIGAQFGLVSGEEAATYNEFGAGFGYEWNIPLQTTIEFVGADLIGHFLCAFRAITGGTTAGSRRPRPCPARRSP